MEGEIREVLNRHCAENESNTPDFILAQYLYGCLTNLNYAIRKREDWYGRNPSAGPAGATGDGIIPLLPPV